MCAMIGSTLSDRAAVSDEGSFLVERWYVASGCRRDDRRAMCERECTPHDEKAASRLAPQGDDGRFDFFVAMNGRNDWLDLE